MKFEDYVKEEFDKINDKIDSNSQKIENLLIFMAVKKSEDSRANKITAMIVSGIVTVLVSLIIFIIEKKL